MCAFLMVFTFLAAYLKLMKILFSFLLFILSTMVFFGCKTDQTITITSKKSTSFTLPGSSVSGIYIKLEADAIATEIEKLATDNNTTVELLNSAEISNLVVTLTEPANTTINFIDEFELYLKNTAGDTLSICENDTLNDSQKIASALTLQPKNRTELINWLKDDNLLFMARLKINSFSPDDRKFTVNATFSIDGTRQ